MTQLVHEYRGAKQQQHRRRQIEDVQCLIHSFNKDACTAGNIAEHTATATSETGPPLRGRDAVPASSTLSSMERLRGLKTIWAGIMPALPTIASFPPASRSLPPPGRCQDTARQNSLFTTGGPRYVRSMDLEANLNSLRERIARACDRAGRDPATVTLLPVTKGQPPERILEAARLGLTTFGESKVQELKAKCPLCSNRLRWHMIGHLQTNKCRDAVQLCDAIQSVDSLHLAQEIHKRAEAAAKSMPIFLEVNVAGEASKSGYRPDALLAELPALNSLRRLEIQGLMTVPPWSTDPARSRPFFAQLRELKGRCEVILDAPLPHLSLGMSDDFEVAIEEGSTLIRIGTLLFGPRQHTVQVT